MGVPRSEASFIPTPSPRRSSRRPTATTSSTVWCCSAFPAAAGPEWCVHVQNPFPPLLSPPPPPARSVPPRSSSVSFPLGRSAAERGDDAVLWALLLLRRHRGFVAEPRGARGRNAAHPGLGRHGALSGVAHLRARRFPFKSSGGVPPPLRPWHRPLKNCGIAPLRPGPAFPIG